MQQRGKGILKHDTDVKIFILFLMSTLRYPLTGDEVLEVMTEDGFVADYDLSICLSELCEMGHIIHEKIDGKDMYMISPLGLEVSASLEDSILSVVRKQSLQTATRYLSLRRRGAFVKSSVTHAGQGRYVVSCLVEDQEGEIGSFRLTVPTAAIAEQIKRHFCKNPEEVIKGVTTAATGEVAYLLPGFADIEDT